MIYLYLKIHNVTKLKYLGKTIQNPFKYKGSGLHWKRHLKIHGDNVSTKILRQCQNKQELQQWGEIYSRLFNVVESKDFANCKIEKGDGGLDFHTEETKKKISRSRMGEKNPMWGKKRSQEFRERIRESNKNRILSSETREKIKLSQIGKKLTDEHKRKISESVRLTKLRNKING